MHRRTVYGGWLLAAVLAGLPGLASAQQFVQSYAPADPQLPVPLGSTRPEDGGFYAGAKVMLYRQTNPLRTQPVAIRGFFAYDTGGTTALQVTPGFRPVSVTSPTGFATLPGDVIDTSINVPLPTGATTGITVISGLQFSIDSDGAGGTFTTLQGEFVLNTQVVTLNGLFSQQGFVSSGSSLTGQSGTGGFINSGAYVSPGFPGTNQVVLDVSYLKHANPYQPGTELTLGWKFKDGSSLALNWLYLTEVQMRAGATLAPETAFLDPGLVNTFLFSPVYNIPPEYAGAPFKVQVPPGSGLNVNPQTVFGIWNGASIMTLEFRQRFQQYELVYREPIWETETYRLSGLVGPRYTWLWEKFKWTTTSIGQDQFGNTISAPEFVGIYTNITSNRMYGAHAGCEQEWYVGHGFALHVKTEGALFLDSAKERAKYETAAKYLGLPENKRAKREWALVPELQASVGVMWYPTEFVQLYAAYEFMAFFNTRASPRPIDFDYSNLNPRWTHVNRYFDGFQGGIAITF